MTARLALALCALAACRPRYRPPADASPGPADVVHDARVADDAAAAREASLVVTGASGSVSVDRSLRVPASGMPMNGRAAVGDGLFAGDQVRTAVGGDAKLSRPRAGDVTLAAEGDAEAPAYEGATLVLTRGVADVASPMGADAVRVDAPAGRAIVSGGRALVGVADDGAVAVAALDGVVTVWPSPPPPPDRATRLSPEERRRRALASPGHPVLLDVDLPELARAEVRPVAPRPLAVGASLAWGPAGDALPRAFARGDAAALRAAVERWVRARNAATSRREGHLAAIEALSRAGAGDVADLRASLARLRTDRAMTTRERDDALARVSLALGRLTARARRGRGLATRGGEVTALVQTAPMEELREAAAGL